MHQFTPSAEKASGDQAESEKFSTALAFLPLRSARRSQEDPGRSLRFPL